MKIFVKVKSKAKRESMERVDETRFIVAVKEPPEKGRANRAVERGLAKYFGVPASRVRVVSGQKSREKVVEIG